MADDESLAVTVTKAVKISGVGRSTIYAWIATGLPHFESVNGGVIYIPREALERRIKEEAGIPVS